MSATVADYRVLDAGFRLRLSSGDLSHRLGVDLDDGYVAGTNIARPILQFMVRAFQDNSRLVVAVNGGLEFDDFTKRVVVNSSVVMDREFDASPIRTYYTLIDGQRFSPGPGNSITFGINGDGSDDVLVENVVLWHQRRVAT